MDTDTAIRHPTPTVDNSATGRARTLAVGLALLVAATLTVPAVTGGVGWLATTLGAGDDFLLVYAVGGTLATLSMAALALGYRRLSPVAMPLRVPRGREWGWVLVGIVGPIAGSLLIGLGATALGVGTAGPATTGIERAAAIDPVLVYVLAVLSALFLIGPAEELLYRGAIQGRLRAAFGPGVAIGLTALGFGAGHVGSYLLGGSDPFSGAVAVSLLSIVVSGVVLGALYERTGNLAVPILAHSLVNALLLTVSLALAL